MPGLLLPFPSMASDSTQIPLHVTSTHTALLVLHLGSVTAANCTNQHPWDTICGSGILENSGAQAHSWSPWRKWLHCQKCWIHDALVGLQWDNPSGEESGLCITEKDWEESLPHKGTAVTHPDPLLYSYMSLLGLQHCHKFKLLSAPFLAKSSFSGERVW